MPYAATWINANESGLLEGGLHRIMLSDPQELADAVNRRRLLTYQQPQSFASQVYGGAPIREPTVASAVAPPFDSLRLQLADKVLSPPTGSMGGDPPSPSSMTWLWPLADADENKAIVSGASGVGQGQVGLFQKLNGTNHWTDSPLSAALSGVRAVHFNEMRKAASWLRRGRWALPVYLPVGLFSVLPDAPWIGEMIANNGANELRTLGYAVIRTDEESPRGLTNATARAATHLDIVTSHDCTVEIYHCLRPIDFLNDPPTWNRYAPNANGYWTAPGGTGSGDAVCLGTLSLQANQSGSLCCAQLTAAVQNMIDGAEQCFLIRRSDTGYPTIMVAAALTVEFDLQSPPN